jgi:hypothetical protein
MAALCEKCGELHLHPYLITTDPRDPVAAAILCWFSMPPGTESRVLWCPNEPQRRMKRSRFHPDIYMCCDNLLLFAYNNTANDTEGDSNPALEVPIKRVVRSTNCACRRSRSHSCWAAGTDVFPFRCYGGYESVRCWGSNATNPFRYYHEPGVLNRKRRSKCSHCMHIKYWLSFEKSKRRIKYFLPSLLNAPMKALAVHAFASLIFLLRCFLEVIIPLNAQAWIYFGAATATVLPKAYALCASLVIWYHDPSPLRKWQTPDFFVLFSSDQLGFRIGMAFGGAPFFVFPTKRCIVPWRLSWVSMQPILSILTLILTSIQPLILSACMATMKTKQRKRSLLFDS